MMGGCAPGSAEDASWTAPLFVEVTALSCPKPDPALRREFRSGVKAPASDTVDANGKPTVSGSALKAKVDELRLAVERKNAAGNRALNDHERCVAGAAAGPTS